MERDLGTKMNFRCDEKRFLIFNVYLRCINIKKNPQQCEFNIGMTTQFRIAFTNASVFSSSALKKPSWIDGIHAGAISSSQR